jgi:hypothetical protein
MTFDERRAKQEEDDASAASLKYAVRRGKHLFVKRGGGVDYMDSFTSAEEINRAALKIQNRYRVRKARAALEKKRREDCVDLYSLNFVVAGCPLVAIFCLVYEPMFLVKLDDFDESVEDYDFSIRPSLNLTKEERIAKIQRKSKKRYCLEMTITQAGSIGEQEIVFRVLIPQAELTHMVPKSINFTQFEFVDLKNDHAVAHMQKWLPHIARRVVVKKGKVGSNDAAFNRDLALRKKLKLERTLRRTCARVGWGPQWRNWWVYYYLQIEVRLDECRMVINATSKDRRHPGTQKVSISCRQMTTLLGYHEKIEWRTFLEQKQEDVEANFSMLISKLRLVNTVEGARLILRGEETLYQLVQWPEERGQHRLERNSATIIQKIQRGRSTRRRVNELKKLNDIEKKARRNLLRMDLESKRRSSAAVTLQASVKRGFARKRADTLRKVIEEDANTERLKFQLAALRERKAVVIQSVMRGGLGRRRVSRYILEKRAAEKEREGIFECDEVVNGTRLYIVGQIQLGLASIDDMVIKLEATDVGMGRVAKLTIGNAVIGKVVEEMEEEYLAGERTRIGGGGDVGASSSSSLNLRGVFLRVVAKLTLFKSVEKNIFILAFKKVADLEAVKKAEAAKMEAQALAERRKTRRATKMAL